MFRTHRIVTAVLVSCCAGMALGATYTCPTVPANMPLPGPKELDKWKDKKGGTWTLTCTNSSRSGDFIWEYQANAMAAKIQIGKCVYVGGENDTYEDIDPTTKNIKTWRHTCFNPTPDADGKYSAILDVFDKEAGKTTRRYLKYDPAAATPEWTEVSARRDTSAATYASFSPVDGDGDGVADQGFDYLSSDLYGAADPDLPGMFESRITIENTFNGVENSLFFDVGERTPALTQGDSVILSNLTLSMMNSIDPRFAAADTSEGLVLTALTSVPLSTGLELAKFMDVGPSGLFTRWAIEDLGAADYWANIFDDDRPLEELGFSSSLDFSDSPGYASGYGNVTLVPVPSTMLIGLLVPVAAARRRRA